MPLFQSALVLLLSFALHNDTNISASFGTKAVSCTCEKGESVNVFDDHADFKVSEQKIVVGLDKVTAPDDQTITLPAGWKQLTMTDGKTGIDLTADGKLIGTILPTNKSV